METVKKASALRVRELGGRDATVLEHDSLRVLIDDMGSMIPELSLVNGKQRLNAHWLPWFRSNSGKPYRDTEDGEFWKAQLLYHVAGSFPCIPNFGPGHIVDGINMPPHGWTANQSWLFRSSGIDEESGAVWALSVLNSPDSAMPLSFRKIDALIPGQNIHYISISVKNNGDTDLEINAGWHNTVGAPFLAEGCRISGAASAWATAALGGEFDTTTRLVPAAEFSSLTEAPLAAGGKTDLSRVPGPLGYTDFVTGRIDDSVNPGWSSVVNPGLKTAYLCFFPGPASASGPSGTEGEEDIILRFNELWMQYGGRPFTPWAPYEGGTDLCYCLGTENAVAAYAMGLEYSRRIREIMGAPTTVIIPGGRKKYIRYGCLFAPYGGEILDGGVRSVEAEAAALVCQGTGLYWRFNADPFFTILKTLEKQTFSL